MKKMFLLFSHTLTQAQIENAQKSFGVEEFVALSPDLQQIWSQIDPDLASLQEILEPLKEYLHKEASKGDYVLIQGDFGAVYLMVEYAKKLGLIPVYATTKRRVLEYIDTDGNTVKQSKFEHRRFREYD